MLFSQTCSSGVDDLRTRPRRAAHRRTPHPFTARSFRFRVRRGHGPGGRRCGTASARVDDQLGVPTHLAITRPTARSPPNRRLRGDHRPRPVLAENGEERVMPARHSSRVAGGQSRLPKAASSPSLPPGPAAEQHRFLRREVEVERRPRDAGTLGQLVDGDALSGGRPTGAPRWQDRQLAVVAGGVGSAPASGRAGLGGGGG